MAQMVRWIWRAYLAQEIFRKQSDRIGQYISCIDRNEVRKYHLLRISIEPSFTERANTPTGQST